MTVGVGLGFSGVGARTLVLGLVGDLKCFCHACGGGGVDGMSVGCSSRAVDLLVRLPPPNSKLLSNEALTHPHLADMVVADAEDVMDVSSND